MLECTMISLCTSYSASEQDQSRAPIMKFQQQQQTHSDSCKMNILLILRKSENKDLNSRI
eukprot:COSAG01_NODE_1504_length_10094_cov_24.449925_14_plen_60_part_00